MCTDVAAAVFLKFEFAETPSRVVEPHAYHLSLEVMEDGKFNASWRYGDEAVTQPTVPAQSGTLSVEEITQLRDACATTTLLDDKISNYDIGYAIKPEPGWKGKLIVVSDGKTRGARFTSLRPASFPERDPALNRLVTLVLDLKNLTRDKLHVPVLRAKPIE